MRVKNFHFLFFFLFSFRVVIAMKHSILTLTTQRREEKKQDSWHKEGWKMNGDKGRLKKGCAYRKKNDEKKREGRRSISNSGNER